MRKTALTPIFVEKSPSAPRIAVCTPDDMENLVEIQPFNRNLYLASDKRHKDFPPLLEPLGRSKEIYILCLDPENRIMGGATLHSPAEIPAILAGYTIEGQAEPTDLIWGQISVGAKHRNKGLSKLIMDEMLTYLNDQDNVTRIILTPLEKDGKAYLGQKGHLHRFAESCPCPVSIYDEAMNIHPIKANTNRAKSQNQSGIELTVP